MIYTDKHTGRRVEKKYVLILDMGKESGGICCHGVFDTDWEAVGKMMRCIWNFGESYIEEGGTFKVGDLVQNENSESITVTFKHPSWEKEEQETWYIMTSERTLRGDKE